MHPNPDVPRGQCIDGPRIPRGYQPPVGHGEGVYRSPDGNLEWFLDSLEKLVLSLENRRTKNNLVLGGDVNIDILKGEKHSEDFLNLLKSLNLYCLVWEPTRGNSCLDNVATDLPKRLLKTEVKRLAVSDHDAVSLHVQTALSAVPDGSGRRVCRPISTDKINNFIYRLDNTNWDFLYNTGAAEDTFNCFFQNFLLMFNECFPTRLLPTKRSKKNQNLPDWKDQSLVTWKKWVLLAYDLYRDNKTPDSELRYKTIKKQYKQKLLSARLERNARFIESASNCCAAAWKVIHEEGAPSKSQLISSVTAEAFNAHFIDSVQQTRDAINGSATSALDMLEKRDPAASRFNITLLSCESVIRVVQKLNNSPSKDIFEVSVNLIKSVFPSIVKPFTYCLNLCLSEGVFPQRLKIAKVIPIHKKGDPNSPENFRPISLLPVFSKIFESVIKDQLYKYFEEHNLLMTGQCGFRAGLSTIDALDKLEAVVLHGFEAGGFTGATLCDLSKAFDTVDHRILLDKLNFYGVKGSELRLMESYLAGREQRVLINGHISSPCQITHGVPQG
ncbi:uncharacterized protein LOC128998827 [Macrosteles quadrilineatus]|uniref:uncharacterized protein LOC128998827 n=1 Tax=Macrosteles quadrilineatus TaxID=74068 RepID=UPI0023E1C3B6|nr:uncharacterized protein LOC128998827 [Macrosteles quadrilineatus]